MASTGSSKHIRVLVADKLVTSVTEALNKRFTVHTDASLNGDALRAQITEFCPNIIVVRSTKITKRHLQASSSLALIIRAGAGINTIAVDDASNLGIFVLNCPGKNAVAVAELAMGHLINMDRRIADNIASLKSGTWNKKGFSKSRGLCGRTLSILGTGAVGRELAKRALAFGMTVRGYDIFLTPTIAKELGIVYCASIKELLTNSDALSVHVPHNKYTHYMINKDVLSLMNDGAYIINTSRGGVVNEKEMMLMIKEKNMKYGCDVYENEPKSSDKLFKDKAIISNPGVYGSHHIGASTDQAADAVGSEVLRLINLFTTTGEVSNCVNLAQKSPAKYSLSIRHKDVVGVLAQVLDYLKNDEVNVQEMSNIVFKGAKSAYAILHVDPKPSDYAISHLRNNPNIYGIEISTMMSKL